MNQVKFGPKEQEKAKEEERFFPMQLISQEKILTWELIVLREPDLNS